MTKEGILNHAFSKIALAFLLLISMVTPFVTVPSAQAAEPITVAEAIANNTGTATVHGYIVGYMNSTTSVDLTAPFPADTNLAIADSPNETDINKIMPVGLTTSFR